MPCLPAARAVRARYARPARPEGALCARLRRADAAADKAAAARTLGYIFYMYRGRLPSPHYGLFHVWNYCH